MWAGTNSDVLVYHKGRHVPYGSIPATPDRPAPPHATVYKASVTHVGRDKDVVVFEKAWVMKWLKTAAANEENLRSLNAIEALRKEFGFACRAYERGKYIIFKGHAGMRNTIKGVRYLKNNSKVVGMGVGKMGVRNSVRVGGIITFVLVGAVEIAEYLASDDETLGDLAGDVASAGVKTAISAKLAMMAGGALVAAQAPIVLTAGAVLVVGVAVGWLLDSTDQHFGITKKIRQWANAAIRSFSESARNSSRTGGFGHYYVK